MDMHAIHDRRIVILPVMVAALWASGCGVGVSEKGIGATQSIEVGGQKLEVTPTNMIDPLAGPGVVPDAGFRPIGVEIRFKNLGKKPVTFQPGGLVQLLASWRAMSPTEVGGGICATSFTFDELQVDPGETQSGCLVYDAPLKVHVSTLRMHSDSAQRTISWQAK